MASAQAEPCHQPRPRIGLQPRRLFSNLERVPQRLKPDFRPVLTARLRFAEAVPLQNLRKPRNTPANLDSLAACCRPVQITSCEESIVREQCRAFCGTVQTSPE